MGVSRVINRRTAVLGLLLVILATAGFGFAASNTVPSTAAGDGAGVISGYNVTDIDYTLGGTNQSDIDQVDFNLAPLATGGPVAPEVVQIELVANSGTWFNCIPASGGGVGDYVCDVSGVTVVAANQLRVIAHD
jgi:hypothetical protein